MQMVTLLTVFMTVWTVINYCSGWFRLLFILNHSIQEVGTWKASLRLSSCSSRRRRREMERRSSVRFAPSEVWPHAPFILPSPSSAPCGGAVVGLFGSSCPSVLVGGFLVLEKRGDFQDWNLEKDWGFLRTRFVWSVVCCSIALLRWVLCGNFLAPPLPLVGSIEFLRKCKVPLVKEGNLLGILCYPLLFFVLFCGWAFGRLHVALMFPYACKCWFLCTLWIVRF